MIARLSISNFLLIERLELELHPGMNIITGETGAGKSILMDALGLLSGERADPKSLRHPDKKCCIEAWFRADNHGLRTAFENAGIDFETENILRREILPGGKSRAFINDSPVTLEVMRPLAMLLFDIHGQQDSQLLGNPETQFLVLDVLAGTSEKAAAYAAVFRRWKNALKTLEQLQEKRQQHTAEFDFKSFLLQELSEAALRDGEQEELESRLQLMQHSGDILSRLQQAADALEGRGDVLGNLKTISGLLAKVSSYSPELESLSQRLNSAWLELKDLSSGIRDLENGLELDPQQMQADEERLSRIYSLQKKHRTDAISGLLKLQVELETFLQQFGQQEEGLEKLEHETKEMAAEMARQAEELHAARSAKLEAISGSLQMLLSDMAMPRAKFSVQLEEAPKPGPFGKAAIRYLFSANPGLPLSDLKNAASGGEFSRLMLAFKCLMAAGTDMPSLIFDEIDTGISGEVAMRVGKLIRQMAGRHQVLVITHSAQMASRAEAHWKVEKMQEKESTETRVRLLSTEESALEIAAMISGQDPGKAALEAARELINA
jgi:DNA repair protein RecN (Recombination protein N)